jgi:hypothetical protein
MHHQLFFSTCWSPIVKMSAPAASLPLTTDTPPASNGPLHKNTGDCKWQ